jgi:hypothetical protein
VRLNWNRNIGLSCTKVSANGGNEMDLSCFCLEAGDRGRHTEDPAPIAWGACAAERRAVCSRRADGASSLLPAAVETINKQ